MKKYLSDDEAVVKFDKSRAGQLLKIYYEIQSCENRFKDYDKASYAASALWIATKGTKLESEAKRIIEFTCPDFFIINKPTTNE